MATAETIVQKALSFVGVTEDPKGSNNVIFNTDYYGRVINDPAYAWCVVFVWDVFRMCGASSLFYDGKKTAGCSVVYTWGKNAKLTVGKTDIRRGDLVLYDWNANASPDHIGIALGPVANGKVDTVEGNTEDCVAVRNRDLSNVCLVIRPKYDPEPEQAPNCSDCPLRNAIKKLIEEYQKGE